MNPNNEETKESTEEEVKKQLNAPVRSKRDAKRLTVIQKEVPMEVESKDVETNSAPGVLLP